MRRPVVLTTAVLLLFASRSNSSADPITLQFNVEVLSFGPDRGRAAVGVPLRRAIVSPGESLSTLPRRISQKARCLVGTAPPVLHSGLSSMSVGARGRTTWS